MGFIILAIIIWLLLTGAYAWWASWYVKNRVLRILADEARGLTSVAPVRTHAGWLTLSEITERFTSAGNRSMPLTSRESRLVPIMTGMAQRGLVVSSFLRGGSAIEPKQLPELFCLSPDEARKRGVPAPSLLQTATA